MENNAGNCRPEFVELLDAIKIELDKLETNSRVIMDKTCAFRDFRLPVKSCDESMKPEPNRGGIIGDFDIVIARLRAINELTEETRNGLTRFVG